MCKCKRCTVSAQFSLFHSCCNAMIEPSHVVPLYTNHVSQNMSMTPMPMQSMSMYHGHQYVSQATEGLQGQGNSGTQTQVGSSSSQPQGSASTASQGGDFLSTKEQYDQIMQILNNTPSSYSSKCSRISSVAR